MNPTYRDIRVGGCLDVHVERRADGSLLMSQRKQGDKEEITFWSADGKALEKGSLAEMKAAQEMLKLMDSIENTTKAMKEQLQ